MTRWWGRGFQPGNRVLSDAERGPLLETLVLHELRAPMNVSNSGGRLSYWGTPSQSEVDFIWSRGSRAIGIEVKASRRWRREFGRTLTVLHEAGHLEVCWGVYSGAERLRDGVITVLPIVDFMRELGAGRILPD